MVRDLAVMRCRSKQDTHASLFISFLADNSTSTNPCLPVAWYFILIINGAIFLPYEKYIEYIRTNKKKREKERFFIARDYIKCENASKNVYVKLIRSRLFICTGIYLRFNIRKNGNTILTHRYILKLYTVKRE